MQHKTTSETAIAIFEEAVAKYHHLDDVAQPRENPYPSKTIEHLFYLKNWIDTVQWHYEDLIRDPNIDPEAGMTLKRKIDASNQDRTDTVEFIDSFYLEQFQSVTTKPEATHNSESPAWAIDRLSILVLKIYHMKEEAFRKDASEEHRQKCLEKLNVLELQQKDLANAIDRLMEDIRQGNKYMKEYKQMKMYNDEALNPVLYQKK